MKNEISLFPKSDILYTKGHFEVNTWRDYTYPVINSFTNSSNKRKFRKELNVAELYFFNKNGNIFISQDGSFRYVSAK